MQGIRRVLARSDDLVGRVAEAGAALSCACLLAMVAMVFGDVALRAVTGRNLDFVVEVVGYALAAITYGSLAYALRRDELLRIGLLAGLTRRFPRLDRALHVVVLLTTLAIMALPAWYFWLGAKRQYVRGTVSPTSAEIPMWIPEGVMLVGLLLFVAQVALQLLNALAGNAAHRGATLGESATDGERMAGMH